MNLTKILRRFVQSPTEPAELRRVARALGNELPKHRHDLLDQFRAEMARINLDESDYADGYRAGLLDVTVEYQTSIRQAQDRDLLHSLVLHEGWREVLDELQPGPQLPSTIADRLSKSRSYITRTLQKLRALGLVQVVSDTTDGRARPHGLTNEGRRMLEGLRPALSADVELGIGIAVNLFQHILSNGASSEQALADAATAMLGDGEAAHAAIDVWAHECEQAGLIQCRHSDAHDHEEYQLASSGVDLGGRSDVLWHQVPMVLDQVKERKHESIPVYVRTGEDGWAAWVHALNENDRTGASRTIVNGDILSRSVQPPAERFDLIYDNPAAILADQNEPTMRAFMELADDKFVITYGEEDVPDGFIKLKLMNPGSEMS